MKASTGINLLIATTCVATPILVAVASAVILRDATTPKEKAAPKEFVCYDDGRLVERHVGVKRARRDHSMWIITYTDSDIVARYHQPFGETCFVDEKAVSK